jgi:hypothetical protein
MGQDHPSLRGTTLRTPSDSQRSGVLIMGVRRGDVFAATEVLISADTLGDEEAIRTWLAQHDIHVTPPCSNITPTHKGSTEVIGPSGTPGQTRRMDDHRTG